MAWNMHICMEVQLMPDTTDEWLDGSKISMLHLCPQKFYRRYEQHLQPKVEHLEDYANAANFGTALHAGLAALYSGEAMVEDTCPCPALQCEYCGGRKIPRIIARFLLHYPTDPPIDPDSRYKDPRTRDTGIEILKTYVQLFFKQRRDSFTVVGTELGFDLPFNDTDGTLVFTYVGRIDLLILDELNGALTPWDHKSTTKWDKFWESGWRLNHSMTGYMYSTHKFTGVPCMNGVINGIRVGSKIDESSFKRLNTGRTPTEFDEWQKEVWNAWALIQLYRKQNFWPKHSPFACSAYYRQCEYYNLCCASGDKEMERNLIEANFEKREWHPFHGMD
jgi:hypothetical protein